MLPVPHRTLINASAKSPTSVNALAGNGVGHPVPERMVWKSNPLIVGSYKMLSREEMSIQTRLTGHVPFSESKMCPRIAAVVASLVGRGAGASGVI